MFRSRAPHSYAPLCQGEEEAPHLCLGRCDYCGARMYAGEHPVAVPGTHDRVHLHCLTPYLEENPIPLQKEVEE